MNPAWSVIVFTTLAGAAQGLVVALVLAAWVGVGVSAAFTSAALALALTLLFASLAASFLHLGHPERAWRAVLMWRTSWLSREVIVLPLFIAGVALWWLALRSGLRPRWSLAPVVALAVLLWWCTAMVYACQRSIAEWAHALTIVNYVLIGLSSGLVLACGLAALTGEEGLLGAIGVWAVGLTALAAAVRVVSLVRNAWLVPRSTVALRGVKGCALLLGFALPLALMVYGQARGLAWPWLVALVLQWPGLLAERWLFFAQARHPQNLYHQVVS